MTEPPNELRKNVAKRLKQARETAGLSQGQVAKKLNMHRPTISEIEAGRRRVSAEEIFKFSELYSIDANWITKGSVKEVNVNDKVLLAARELSKLKDRDIEKIMDLIQMLQGSGEED